jgi:hypothetical protein
MKISSALGGLAGACALTVMNEGAKKLDKDAPRLDLLGMNAVAKIMKGTGLKQLSQGNSMPVALTGDLISNSLYFGMAGTGETKKQTLVRGALLGLGAGLGAVTLAKPLGLNEQTVAATPKTKVLTVAWYVIGGIVAAAVINLLDNEK